MRKRFTLIYFGGMLLELLIRIPYARGRRQIAKTDQRVTATEQGVLGFLAIGTLLLPLLATFTSWLRFADYRWAPRTAARAGALGSAFFAGAMLLFWRSHHDLGSNWSPTLEIGAKHTLVTQGIYRYIRHPMYASQWFWSIGQILLLQNWIAGFAGIIGFLPLYLLRVPREEQMMLDHFGEEYRSYMERTGRVVPRIG